MTRTILQLAELALPVDDAEWGSDRQVNAANDFGAALYSVLSEDDFSDFENYALKATTEEMVNYGLELAHANKAAESV